MDANTPSVKAVSMGRVWRVDVELRLGVVQTFSTCETRSIYLSILKIGLVDIVWVKQPAIESSQLVVNLVTVRATIVIGALQLGLLDVLVGLLLVGHRFISVEAWRFAHVLLLEISL